MVIPLLNVFCNFLKLCFSSLEKNLRNKLSLHCDLLYLILLKIVLTKEFYKRQNPLRLNLPENYIITVSTTTSSQDHSFQINRGKAAEIPYGL